MRVRCAQWYTYRALLSDGESRTKLGKSNKRTSAHFDDCFIEHLSVTLTGAEKRGGRAYLDYLYSL